MPKKYRTGLTLGKFAPLHEGHEHLIETMRSECEHAIVLVYDTDVIDVPLPVRANWIRTLYPDVEVIKCWDGPDGYSSERAFEIIQEDYVLGVLGGRRVDAFYSSEFYGEHMARALDAVDRRVDEERIAVPISGTMVRADPNLQRAFVSPLVYRDLIVKVVFMGAPSTGKTTLVEALAKRFDTSFALEYGREYWTEHQVDRRIGFEEFDTIATVHQKREEEAFLRADRVCFVDTNAITTYMFSLDYHGSATDLLTALAWENAARYDLFFLCADDIPYDDTWDRSGVQKRGIFQRQIRADLDRRKLPYVEIGGTLDERIDAVERQLTGQFGITR